MKINRLKEVFDNRNVKNRVLANYFGKSESTISLWRNNKRQPSLDELREIAKLLRIDIRDLIEPTSWKDENSETYEEFSARIKRKN
ncbi:helix-turn-helix domain-containing protein [Chryseobacterium sp. SL1]|uniref:helix-turn-helix domain-containing protein n=1 Tax=Chryseobacterium sp. SL1 TaxID=2995159 RepID=UPI002273DD76|nr:helix-turn-helix transcriptional regulator [Chryseobacterium sp. SL1]MCY1661035.1 helix-turn-helix transcriptional regulator [Chryseobacterium sp. SL1]